MPDSAPLLSRIARLFGTRMNVEVPSVDTDLLDTGLLDSLAFVDLLVLLEQEFGVQVSVDELEIDNFRSVSRIAEFAANKLKMAA